MAVDEETFRSVMGSFATGVTVLTQPGDPPHGMTVNAFSSVSMDPPLCLVCVDHDTTCYDRFEAGVDAFAVTMLAADQRDLGEHFADITVLADSPFETRATSTHVTDAPVFDDGLAYLDCTVAEAHEAGDHTIYVGAIEAADVLDGEAAALTFFRGEWGQLGDA
ncbi:MAG: flavin reductase family protein [Halobacteriaceae archaeon]